MVGVGELDELCVHAFRKERRQCVTVLCSLEGRLTVPYYQGEYCVCVCRGTLLCVYSGRPWEWLESQLWIKCRLLGTCPQAHTTLLLPGHHAHSFGVVAHWGSWVHILKLLAMKSVGIRDLLAWSNLEDQVSLNCHESDGWTRKLSLRLQWAQQKAVAATKWGGLFVHWQHKQACWWKLFFELQPPMWTAISAISLVSKQGRWKKKSWFLDITKVNVSLCKISTLHMEEKEATSYHLLSACCMHNWYVYGQYFNFFIISTLWSLHYYLYFIVNDPEVLFPLFLFICLLSLLVVEPSAC
jgi:hypothetical protein